MTLAKQIHKLTPKQQNFCYHYVETGIGAEAYRRAYNASSMSAPTVWVEASRLLKNPKVALRVQELREKVMERAELSVESVLTALIEDRALARRLGNPSAAIKADIYLGKHIGMWPTKIDIKGTVEHRDDFSEKLSELTLDELRALAEDARRERALLQGTVIEGEARGVE